MPDAAITRSFSPAYTFYFKNRKSTHVHAYRKSQTDSSVKCLLSYCIGFAGCLASLLFLHLLFACNRFLFYYPSRNFYARPEQLGLKYKEYFFQGVDENRLHAWLIYPRSAETKASIIQFHGNAENMSSHFLSLAWLTNHGYELFSFDYRGYGLSEKSPDTAKIIADSKILLRFLLKRNEQWKRPIIVYGQSLGGILAAYTLGSMPKPSPAKALVLEGSFSSYVKIGQEKGNQICWPLGLLAKLLISDRYSVDSLIPRLHPLPILIIHGTQDQVVSFQNALDIYNLAKEPKYLLEIPLAKHLDWHHLKRYNAQRKELLELLDKILNQQGP